jgi:hypothetical protein
MAKKGMVERFLSKSEVSKRASAVQKRRSKRAKAADEKRSAVNTIQNPTNKTMRLWEKHPERYDIAGIDDPDSSNVKDCRRKQTEEYRRENAKRRSKNGVEDSRSLLEDERADEFDRRAWKKNDTSTVISADDYAMNHREMWDTVYSERCKPKKRKSQKGKK